MVYFWPSLSSLLSVWHWTFHSISNPPPPTISGEACFATQWLESMNLAALFKSVPNVPTHSLKTRRREKGKARRRQKEKEKPEDNDTPTNKPPTQYTPEETGCLAWVWSVVYQDPYAGRDQTKYQFQKRIQEIYNQRRSGKTIERDDKMFKSCFGRAQAKIRKFNGCYCQESVQIWHIGISIPFIQFYYELFSTPYFVMFHW